MVAAVHYLHTKHFMVHRDLHHGNWMITQDCKVTLIDFGLAKILGENGITKEFWVPEQY